MTKPITAVKATIGVIDRISDNQIMMTLTASDEHHAFEVSTGNIVDSVRRAMACINSNLPAVLRDTGMM